MRQEQDSLGDLELLDDEYFGISTARLLAVLGDFGPETPIALARNIVMVRQAQAMAYGHNGAWNKATAELIQTASERLLENEIFFAEQLKIRTLHGGGARSLVVNIDEVIANVALGLQNRPRGEYHRLACLLRLDNGFANHQVCVTALHTTIIPMLEELTEKVANAIQWMRKQGLCLREQDSIAQINYQDVKIFNLGETFFCHAAGLERLLRQLSWYRKEYAELWNEMPEVLTCLGDISGIELKYDATIKDYPICGGLYCGLSSLLRNLASHLMQIGNELKRLVVLRKELDLPKRLPSPVFNPANRETLVPDTISQIAVTIAGNDASISAATNLDENGTLLSFPLIAKGLIDSLQYCTVAVQLLTTQCLMELQGLAETGLELQENSLLQAEKLIPVIGYERAVQVARIAALTEKPVRTVVVRMKLLDEEQTSNVFSRIASTDHSEK